MKLVFDIGMYDGADTAYYLSEGYKVVAVEANPTLIERAKCKFANEIASAQLVLVNKAVCEDSGEEITLTISGDDLGSSSILEDKVIHKNPLGSFQVKGVTLLELFERYGRPYFIKVDVEGADRYGVLPITEQNRPQYVSFEAGDDIQELILHLQGVGFTGFKAINQCNFNELANQRSFIFRVKRKLISLLGYHSPRYVRRNGRFFRLGHSAGPAPWVSDGSWQSADALLSKWKRLSEQGKISGWYDVHVM